MVKKRTVRKAEGIIAADWTSKEIAEQNHTLNKSYFRKKTYKNFPAYTKLSEAITYVIDNDATRPLSMLDYGCGAGWVGVYLKKEGFDHLIRYSGVDLSPHMCNYGRLNYPEGDFKVANAETDCFNGQYDVVIEGALIELVPAWSKAIKNIFLSSKKWVILHRLYVVEDGDTRCEQVKTYMELPDLRIHIGLDELDRITSSIGFDMVKSDIWERNSGYNHGTFVFKRRQNA